MISTFVALGVLVLNFQICHKNDYHKTRLLYSLWGGLFSVCIYELLFFLSVLGFLFQFPLWHFALQMVIFTVIASFAMYYIAFIKGSAIRFLLIGIFVLMYIIALAESPYSSMNGVNSLF